MSFRVVSLDLDETLAVTTRDRAAILESAARAVGAEGLDREDYLEAHRGIHPAETRTPIFRRLLDGSDPVDAAELAAAYNEHLLEHLDAVPDAAETIAALRRRWPVVLLTNGPSRAQRSKLEALGWADAFDAVVVTGEVGAPKPEQAAFHAALDAVGATAEEAVHVGDQVEADVRGASSAGLSAVQVRYPGGPDPHPAADAVVDRGALGRLPEVLEGLDE